MDYINWLWSVEPALYTWYESHFVVMYNSLYMLLDIIC